MNEWLAEHCTDDGWGYVGVGLAASAFFWFQQRAASRAMIMIMRAGNDVAGFRCLQDSGEEFNNAAVWILGRLLPPTLPSSLSSLSYP